ncbi:ThiJ/PfpI family protein (plasmid) [Sinorhizobium fredii CCBAU 25509]|nr:ThiJ/PfpI family protein [Sinorhizobium fredii CCBAU 25509]
MPCLVEDELNRLGGRFERAADWADFTVVDGRLIAGQDPCSSTSAARELCKPLQ